MGIYAKMNREEVIRVYNSLIETFQLKKEDIWLSAGSALVIHGIREFTSDLDLGCRTETLLKVSKQLGRELLPFPTSVIFCKEVSLQLPVPEYYTDFHSEDELDKDKLVYIDGVGVYSLYDLLEQKQRMILLPKRSDEKLLQDVKDIRAINSMM